MREESKVGGVWSSEGGVAVSKKRWEVWHGDRKGKMYKSRAANW